jgi:hypothetical protein
MQEKSSLPPPCGGDEETPTSVCGSGEDERRAPSRLRFSVAWLRLFRSFWGALALAILVGGALGLELGVRAGGLAQPPSGRFAETAAPPAAGAAEVARLREDVRSLRAQIELLRHTAEIARTAERLKALETAHETSAAHAQLPSATATRLDSLEARLQRLERVGVDATPTALIQRPGARNGRKTAAP